MDALLFINNIREACRNILISGVLGDAKVFAMKACRDWLAVVLTTDVIILGHEVVVYLGEVGFLIGIVSIAKGGLPIISEVLVTRNFLHTADEILPTITVQH